MALQKREATLASAEQELATRQEGVASLQARTREGETALQLQLCKFAEREASLCEREEVLHGE